jgi:hypothetical protein
VAVVCWSLSEQTCAPGSVDSLDAMAGAELAHGVLEYALTVVGMIASCSATSWFGFARHGRVSHGARAYAKTLRTTTAAGSNKNALRGDSGSVN